MQLKGKMKLRKVRRGMLTIRIALTDEQFEVLWTLTKNNEPLVFEIRT